MKINEESTKAIIQTYTRTKNENNKQAIKAIFITDKLLLEIKKKLNNKIKRISRCK